MGGDLINGIIKKDKKLLGLASFLWVLWSFAGIFIFFMIFYLTYLYVSKPETEPYFFYWGIIIGVVVSRGVLFALADTAKHFAGYSIVEKLRSEILHKMKRFSLGYYTRERLGNISTIIHQDIETIELAAAHMGTRLTADLAVSLISLGVLTYLDFKLFFLLVSFIPIGFFILIIGFKKSEHAAKKTSDHMTDMVSRFVEYSKGIPVLKVFKENRIIFSDLEKRIKNFEESSKKFSLINSILAGVYLFFVELSFFTLVFLGGIFVMEKEIKALEYIVFIIFSREFYKPFLNFESYFIYYSKTKESYQRILSITGEPEIKDKGEKLNINDFSIEFNDVSFGYEKEGFKFNKLNFCIPHKKLTALVGPSGAGKTTIANLIIRFYELDGGSITIGGKDISHIDYDNLLSNISIVMQDVILFSGSILDNIKMGKKDACFEDVCKAAQKAMIHDYITGLKDGYQTMLGENGTGLSGGQKQRISIARAILQDAPVIILDEASSALDPVNERMLQKAITNMTENKTVIVIAHNLNSIKNADQILVFNEGSLSERGLHNELLDMKGLYLKLWNYQNKNQTGKIIPVTKGL